MIEQSLGSELWVGDVAVPTRVWLAPMTGISDLAFRETASGLGAGYVATEMVACEQFAQRRPDVVRRAAVGSGLPLMVVQLAGTRAALDGGRRRVWRRPRAPRSSI